jgi:hypothetical protein
MITKPIVGVFELDSGDSSVRTESYTGSLDTRAVFTEYVDKQRPTTQSTAPVEPILSLWYRFIANLLWSCLWKASQRPCVKLKYSSPATRINSDISLYSLPHTKAAEFATETELHRSPDPIRLVLDFEDCTHTKSLDYATFAKWQRVEALLLDMESDGICVNHMWDDIEKMQVTSGDWDARVRPGWEVHVSCIDRIDLCGYLDDRNDEDSTADEDGDGEWIEGGVDKQEWWFARWRHRVESKRSRCVTVVQEPPSWRMIIAVCGLMVPFFWAVVMLTARDFLGSG